MSHLRQFFYICCLSALVSITMVACSDSSDVPPPAAFPYIRMAPTAPPAPLEEDVPVSEDPQGEIWRPGYWDYEGGGFSWVSGEFISRPDPTAVWSPDHWAQHTYGWAFVAGYWQ